jgi:hypothetical protein
MISVFAAYLDGAEIDALADYAAEWGAWGPDSDAEGLFGGFPPGRGVSWEKGDGVGGEIYHMVLMMTKSGVVTAWKP